MLQKNILNIGKGIIVLLLVIASTKQPYGYYQIMRIAVTALFVFLGYSLWQLKQELLSILCWVSALVFQPFEKIALRKRQWHTIDLLFAGMLMVWIAIDVALYLLSRSKNESTSKKVRLLQLMRKAYNNPKMTEQEMMETIDRAKEYKVKKSN